MRISFDLNGSHVSQDVPANRMLLDYLRDDLGLVGAKRSCDVQVCGACAVLLDGDPISSCCFLAVDVDGRSIVTVEGLRETVAFATVEDALVRRTAVQCGFCTPGLAVTLVSLLDSEASLTYEDLREVLAGNLCRCTGYRSILDAAAEATGVQAP